MFDCHRVLSGIQYQYQYQYQYIIAAVSGVGNEWDLHINYESHSTAVPAPKVAFFFFRRLLPSPPSRTGAGAADVRRTYTALASAFAEAATSSEVSVGLAAAAESSSSFFSSSAAAAPI